MTLDTPDADLFDQTIARIAGELGSLGDTDDLDVRRARAVGILADPQHALDLLSGRDGCTQPRWRRREPLRPPHPADLHRDRWGLDREARRRHHRPPRPVAHPLRHRRRQGQHPTRPRPQLETAPSTSTTHPKRCANRSSCATATASSPAAAATPATATSTTSPPTSHRRRRTTRSDHPQQLRTPVPDPPPRQDLHRLGLQTPRPRRHLLPGPHPPDTSTTSTPPHAAHHPEEPDAPPPRPTPAGATGTPTGPSDGFDKLNQPWPRPTFGSSTWSQLTTRSARCSTTLKPRRKTLPTPATATTTVEGHHRAPDEGVGNARAQPHGHDDHDPVNPDRPTRPGWFRQAQPAVATHACRLTPAVTGGRRPATSRGSAPAAGGGSGWPGTRGRCRACRSRWCCWAVRPGRARAARSRARGRGSARRCAATRWRTSRRTRLAGRCVQGGGGGGGLGGDPVHPLADDRACPSQSTV